jgi:Domain of unknown function (DUF4349)
MSQPDLMTQLREARPTAPREVRERVRVIAERAPQPPRRLSWRLGIIVALGAALAIVAALVATRGGDRDAAPAAAPVPEAATSKPYGAQDDRAALSHVSAKAADAQAPVFAPGAALSRAALGVAPSATRLQRYHASLELRVAHAEDVSAATQRALAITRSLGGYPLGVGVDARGRAGDATLTLRIPREKVQEAVTRLSALGTIIASNVQIEDLQVQVNATNKRLARLQRRLRELRAQEQTDAVKLQITALTRQVEALQRSRAATVREARYATVNLQVTTQKAAVTPVTHEDGPFHALGVAFVWIGIVTIYALALAAPFVLLAALLWLAARAVRRRREEALLSAP